jgi:hypothetical protein
MLKALGGVAADMAVAPVAAVHAGKPKVSGQEHNGLTDPLYFSSATAIARAIKEKELSSEEVTSAQTTLTVPITAPWAVAACRRDRRRRWICLRYRIGYGRQRSDPFSCVRRLRAQAYSRTNIENRPHLVLWHF